VCNASKGSLPVFEWWRPKEIWSKEREEVLLAWVYANSFVSAHTDLCNWEAWCEATQRTLPIHEDTKKGARLPLLTMYAA
jgi:hypothetical protein